MWLRYLVGYKRTFISKLDNHLCPNCLRDSHVVLVITVYPIDVKINWITLMNRTSKSFDGPLIADWFKKVLSMV
nr:MAG TPA: hypothetical protein [Caudoviricetes sp.]